MNGWFETGLLHDYNTRVVLAGTVLLGLCSGLVGTLMLLRKRALVGDVASHAALPGVALAYLIQERIWPGEGKWLPGLLTGAVISAAAGLFTSRALGAIRRIKEDTTLGITLSLFFGLGVVLLTMIQGLPTGQAAGLNEFVFGKAAALVVSDVKLIAVAAAIVLVACQALSKEFGLLCFDQDYAAVGGWPIAGLDSILTVLVIGVTVLGMQSVGLLLVVALLVLPPTAARFWTNRLATMQWVAAGLGGFSAAFGVILSASFPRLAAGAVIVLCGTLAFVISLLFGTRNGLVWRLRDERLTRRKIGLHDLLRACYEVLEGRIRSPQELSDHPVSLEELSTARAWTPGRLRLLLEQALMDGSIRYDSRDHYRLTNVGRRAAIEAARNHRLWELYLIHFADMAPQHVDRSADLIEHVLDPDIIEQLQRLLLETDPHLTVPDSPHDPADGFH